MAPMIDDWYRGALDKVREEVQNTSDADVLGRDSRRTRKASTDSLLQKADDIDPKLCKPRGDGSEPLLDFRMKAVEIGFTIQLVSRAPGQGMITYATCGRKC
jgi:hypothetical protein